MRVARVPAVVTRADAKVLLGYSGWLLGCCFAVARVPWLVARVPGAGTRVLLGFPGGC